MRLLENEAKQLLSEAGLPIPRELVTASPAEAAGFAQSLGGPMVIKAQVRPMTLERRVTAVVVEKRVVPQSDPVGLLWRVRSCALRE
jgi:succinyl-CoA synthetase beta subunit